MSRSEVRVGLVQMNCTESPAENLSRSIVKIRECAADGAQVICLQEVFNTQYPCQTEDHARFELAAPCTMNLVCFRLRHGDNAANTALMERANATGRAYLTHTVLPPQVEGQSGAVALRLAVSGAFTQERHVREVWDLVREQAG